MKSVTLGKCGFDLINYLFCYCFLVKPCRDRCFSPWTIVKWLIKGGIIGYTIWLVHEKKTGPTWLGSFETGTLENMPSPRGTTRLDIYLIIYIIQHPIFMAARLPIFLFYSLFTCCCDKGIDLNEDN